MKIAAEEKKRRECENAAFHEWWEASGHAADPVFTLTMENCAHAAWQARAASPASAPAMPHDASPAMVKAALAVDWSNEDEEASVHNIWHAMRAASPASAEPVKALDREMVNAAALAANGRYGQWMPQQWIDFFIEEYGSRK